MTPSIPHCPTLLHIGGSTPAHVSTRNEMEVVPPPPCTRRRRKGLLSRRRWNEQERGYRQAQCPKGTCRRRRAKEGSLLSSSSPPPPPPPLSPIHVRCRILIHVALVGCVPPFLPLQCRNVRWRRRRRRIATKHRRGRRTTPVTLLFHMGYVAAPLPCVRPSFCDYRRSPLHRWSSSPLPFPSS